MTGNAPIPAGWYPDPEIAGQLRYWDGAAWTEHRQEKAAAPPSPYPPAHGGSSNATVALVLSILGILFCGVLSPVGMVMGRNEVQRIDSGEGDPSTRGTAQAAWIVGLIGTVILALALLFVLILLAILAAAA